MNFNDITDEDLIRNVYDGIGPYHGQAANMELNRRLNKSLCTSIENLDKNIQNQSKIEIGLTRAMYVLAGFAFLVAVIQVIIAFLK